MSDGGLQPPSGSSADWTAGTAPLPSPNVQQTMQEMTDQMQSVIAAAERAADAIRLDAEEQARRHLAEAQRKADRLTAERVGLISELTDDLLHHAANVRDHSEQMVRALEEAIDSVAEKLDQPVMTEAFDRPGPPSAFDRDPEIAVEDEEALPEPPPPPPPPTGLPPAGAPGEPEPAPGGDETFAAAAPPSPPPPLDWRPPPPPPPSPADEPPPPAPPSTAFAGSTSADPAAPPPPPPPAGEPPPPPPFSGDESPPPPPPPFSDEAPPPPPPTDEAPPAPPPPDASPPPAAEGEEQVAVSQEAVLHATRMAIAGEDRQRIAESLRDEYGITDPAPILDRVIGE